MSSTEGSYQLESAHGLGEGLKLFLMFSASFKGWSDWTTWRWSEINNRLSSLRKRRPVAVLAS